MTTLETTGLTPCVVHQMRLSFGTSCKIFYYFAAIKHLVNYVEPAMQYLTITIILCTVCTTMAMRCDFSDDKTPPNADNQVMRDKNQIKNIAVRMCRRRVLLKVHKEFITANDGDLSLLHIFVLP